MAAMNFPNSPTEGTVYAAPGGPTYIYRNGIWVVSTSTSLVEISDTPPANPLDKTLWWSSKTGRLQVRYNDGDSTQWVDASGGGGATRVAAKNLLVNGAMMISQENSGNSSVAAATLDYWPADQWRAVWGLVGTAKAQTQAYTDNASYYTILTAVTATPSLAAGNYWQLIQPVEGYRILGLNWGNVRAKRAILRFVAYTNVPGTYTVSITNGDLTRIFLAPFTITAAQVNKWTPITILVPGETTGVWGTGNVMALSVSFNFAAGATYTGGVAGWNTVNMVMLPGSSNLAATAGNYVAIGEVGLYLDVDGSGVPPAWELPDYADDLIACQRYYWKAVNSLHLSGYTVPNDDTIATLLFPTEMRSPPALGIVGGQLSAAAAYSLVRPSTTSAAFYLTADATAGMIRRVLSNGGVTANARM